MKSIKIHSTEVILTEKENERLVVAKNLIDDLIKSFGTYREYDKIGQEDNYINFGALCETRECLDWLCDATECEAPLRAYGKYTD